MFSYMELVSGLYKNVETEIWTKGSCMGTKGPRGEKYECGGSAAICHKFSEAKLQDVADQKIKCIKDSMAKVLATASQPAQIAVLAACAFMEDCVE